MPFPPLVEPADGLSRDEIFRYSRHLIIPDVAMDGQLRLKNARVLLIGAGGLGSPNAMYLAAAGVGHLGLVDFDEVDASNLQRQVIHGTSDIGRSKLDSARDKLAEINPYVEVALHETRLDSENARELIRGYDLVVDGSDNFPTRYLVNDACVLEGKPYVWGSIYRFDGQASVFWAEHGPCYRCLYPEPPPPGMVPSCAEGGVLGVLCATVGSVQANEAIKLLCGIGEPLVGRLLIYDALELEFKDITVRKDPRCAVCGEQPTITELIDYEEFCGVVSGEAAQAAAGATLTPAQLKEILDDGQRVSLVDVREPAEWAINRIEGARLIPLGELPGRLSELPQTEPVVLYCKTGVRSAEALALLKQSGFSTARHLGGGIAAWAKTVDPSLPQY
jgi:adenylyltransferase/sulfurtransferase